MKFNTKYRLALLKRYFDTGYSVTSYIKYMIAFFGLASADLKATLIIGVAYGIFCFIFGYLWIKYNWYTAEQEVSNQYNLFVKEMREMSGATTSYSVHRKT